MGKVFERHRRILQLLSGGSYRTAGEIRDLLEAEGETISERQIKRILNELHADNHLDSRPRNFGLKRGRPPTEYGSQRRQGAPEIERVEPHQALTLQLAAELLDPLLPASILEPLKVELKIAKSVIQRDTPSLKRFPDKVAVLPRGIGRPATRVWPETLATIYKALLEERRLEVCYNAARYGKKQLRTHEISPLGLICRFDTLYLVLVRETEDPSKDPDHVMEWPVHRFNRAELLPTPIRKPPGFKLKAHLKMPGILRNNHDPRLAGLGDSFKIKLRFKERTGHYVVERPFSKDQQADQAPDGSFVVTATVQNTRDLLSELFNFADDVEVLQPKALRDYLKERAEAVAAQYQDKPTPRPKPRRKRAAKTA
jgi:predicted DNA-binding transcriptional regulator YafY